MVFDETMPFYKQYLRRYRKLIYLFLVFCAVFFIVFSLYHLPPGAVLYPMAICTLFGIGFLTADYAGAKKRHERLWELGKRSAELMERFPESKDWLEADYREIIEALRSEVKSVRDAMNLSYADMVDYYTVWAHQIKTPIAALRLYLEGEDSPNARKMREEVFRIEQYVGMVLAFVRLDSESTDYVFAECELDDIVRGAVKKFAGQFIRRKLTLVYEPLNLRFVTDEKWLSFCLEQILSNALKYTRSGSVSITLEPCGLTWGGTQTMSGDGDQKTMLCVRDTGIGIAPEDLPRVFEKGYTGYHGREDKKASGIGLYLCRRICENLGHSITVESRPDVGTTVRIDLRQKRVGVE